MLVISLALASTLTTGTSESDSHEHIDSFDGLDSSNNHVQTSAFVGGFTATAYQVTGNLTQGVDETSWESEADIQLNFPGSTTDDTLEPSPNGAAHVGTVAVDSGVLSLANPFDPADLTGYQFFESFDDTADVVDSHWEDITITFFGATLNDGSFALGVIPSDETPVDGPGESGNAYHSHVATGLDFFTLTVPAITGASDYFSIVTSSAGTGADIDTEIALYDSTGNLVADDDDDGPSTYSALSFGDSDPHTDGTAGQNGATLAAGTYTLVTGPFNTIFPSTFGELMNGDGGTATGDYLVQVIASVEAPPPANEGAGYEVRVKLNGRPSIDGIGDADNRRLNVDTLAGSYLTGYRLNACVRPVGPSWSSEAHLGFRDSGGGDLFDLTPFSADNSDEECVDTGPVDLSIDTPVQIELYEHFVDEADAVESTYLNGSYLYLHFRTLIADAIADMADRTNAAHGSTVITENSGSNRLRISKIQSQLQGLLNRLDANGCSQPTIESLVGAYDSGTGTGTADSSLDGTVRALTFGGGDFSTNVSDTVSVGGADFSTYANNEVVGRRSDGGFVAGVRARVKGNRGVFLTLTGTCHPDDLPGAIEPWSDNDLSDW